MKEGERDGWMDGIEWRQRAADGDDDCRLYGRKGGLPACLCCTVCRRYVEAGNNNGEEKALFASVEQKSRDIKDEGACDRPTDRGTRAKKREGGREEIGGLFYIT